MDSLACHVEVYVDGKTTNDNTHDTLTARKVVKFKEGILRDTTFHHMELLLHCLEDFISHSVTQSGIWARGGMGSEMQWTEGKEFSSVIPMQVFLLQALLIFHMSLAFILIRSGLTLPLWFSKLFTNDCWLSWSCSLQRGNKADMLRSRTLKGLLCVPILTNYADPSGTRVRRSD